MVIFRFAGSPAIILGIAFAILDFWMNVGLGSFAYVTAKATVVGVLMSFNLLLGGGVVYQVRHTLFPMRDALASSALFSIPVIFALLVMLVTEMTLSVEALVLGFFVLPIAWGMFAFYGFVATYIFPRFIGLFFRR